MRNCKCKMNQCSMSLNNACSNNRYEYMEFKDINNSFPCNYLYGHAYTPNQVMNKTFTPEVALKKRNYVS